MSGDRERGARGRLEAGAELVELVAIALWLGGIVALGAVVAPVVFRTVAAPSSADAMTLVFRRFDKVAMGCAAAVLVAEAARVAVAPPVAGAARRWAGVRMALAGIAMTLAVWQGVSLSPRIEALHRGGAIRGLGESGLDLEAVHRLAETVGKGQVLALLLLLGVYAMGRAGSAHPS